ncbi:hypothetical protein ACS0TY_036257 [Phlomoides rotata]
MGLGGKEPKSKNEIEFPSPQWIELPGDVTANILHRLGAVEILQSAQKVCTTWWRVCQDPAMWQVIHITHDGDDRYVQIPAVCRRAVDLSQGQLLDLTIKNFGNVELPNYIVDRSSHLKRLTLQDCDDIRPKGLVEAVKKFPHLEELHLISLPLVRPADIINIGISCPMLKSFSYSPKQQVVCYLLRIFIEDGNKFAEAVAKSMPNLCHLSLVANWMDNEGLEAILDGCPHLESLDLSECFFLDLKQGALGQRCSEQIKHVKYPCHSMGDISKLVADDYF